MRLSGSGGVVIPQTLNVGIRLAGGWHAVGKRLASGLNVTGRAGRGPDLVKRGGGLDLAGRRVAGRRSGLDLKGST